MDSDFFFIETQPDTPPSPDTPSSGRSRSRKASRFYMAISPDTRCFNCREFGHTKYHCVNLNFRVRCRNCGRQDHHTFFCPNVICYKCRGVGHTKNECVTRSRFTCSVCRRPNHSDSTCILKKNSVNPRDEQIIRCLYCGAWGHCNCFEPGWSVREPECSKCAATGHYARRCNFDYI